MVNVLFVVVVNGGGGCGSGGGSLCAYVIYELPIERGLSGLMSFASPCSLSLSPLLVAQFSDSLSLPISL